MVRRAGSAAAFHGRALDDRLGRAVHVFEVEHPALVLGSAQRDDVVDLVVRDYAGSLAIGPASGWFSSGRSIPARASAT